MNGRKKALGLLLAWEEKGTYLNLALSGATQGLTEEERALLTALLYGTADKFRKQHCTFRAGEELFHPVALCTADADIEPLQLPFVGIQSSEWGICILCRWVECFQSLYKALVGQMIQTLFQFQILIHKTISFFDLIFLQVLFNLHGLCRMQTSESLFGFIL